MPTQPKHGDVWYAVISLAAGFVLCGLLVTPLSPISAEVFLETRLLPIPLVAVIFAIATLVVAWILKHWIRQRRGWSGLIINTLVTLFLVIIISATLLVAVFCWTTGTPQKAGWGTIFDLLETWLLFIALAAGVAVASLHIALPIIFGQVWLLRRVICRQEQPRQTP